MIEEKKIKKNGKELLIKKSEIFKKRMKNYKNLQKLKIEKCKLKIDYSHIVLQANI